MLNESPVHNAYDSHLFASHLVYSVYGFRFAIIRFKSWVGDSDPNVQIHVFQFHCHFDSIMCSCK